MLKSKGTALIGMALQAGLFVSKSVRHECGPRRHAPGGCECAMRIMTIGTTHEPGIHRMLEGHREISPDISVASVAEFRLSLR